MIKWKTTAKISYIGKIPSVNELYKIRGNKGKGKKGLYLTNKGNIFKKELYILSKQAIKWKDPIKDKIKLIIFFNFNRKGRDDDNPIKPLKDALQGAVYVNDKQIRKTLYKTTERKDKPEGIKIIVKKEI